MKKKVVVIGAGAAGLMAAAAAADAGAEVTLVEKNEKAGKKLYITGKGRCNLTNACETQDFFDHVVRNGKFLYSAIYGFDQFQVMQFMEENGCPVKTERGNRVFPVSDHASDVTKALLHHLKRKNVSIRYHCKVNRILTEPNNDTDTESRLEGALCRVTGALLHNGEIFPANSVILCTGGLSYPSTGSDGDGIRMAHELGLTLAPTSPSLVPFVAKEEWCGQLQGLSLKNIRLTMFPFRERGSLCYTEEESARTRKKHCHPLYSGFGEMLFTHFGVSGPLVLTASCYTDFQSEPQGYLIQLDLKPALSQEQLEGRLQRELEAAPGRQLANVLRALFPARLAVVMTLLSGLGTDKKASSVNEKQIKNLAALIKSVPIHVTGTRGFSEAIITRGGIDVRQFNPSTMECRAVSGLYAAGEILDVDAHTGGFNLQIAWSTGHLAGKSAARPVLNSYHRIY